MDNNTWVEVKDAIEQTLQDYGVDWMLENVNYNYRDLVEDMMYKLIRVVEG